MAKTDKKPPHLMYQTQFSKTGQADTKNRKPYRTGKLKEEAKLKAEVSEDGAYRSTAPVMYHK